MNLFKDILLYAALIIAEFLFFGVTVAIVGFVFGVGR